MRSGGDMNRRIFFGSAGAGIAGLLFPHRAKSAKPVLEGLTDEDMAKVIARVPQGPNSLMLNFNGLNILEESRSFNFTSSSMHSTWRVEGTTIHRITYSEAYGEQIGVIDVQSIDLIRIRMGCRVDSRQPMCEYRRMSGNWFTFDKSVEQAIIARVRYE